MKKRRAFTLTELLVTGIITILVFASAFGTFVLTKNIYFDTIAAAELQRNVNAILEKMVRGPREGSGIFGVRSAVLFALPVVVPAGSAIDFIGTDGSMRQFFRNGATIVYVSPAQTPNQQVIYTAPAGAVITLRFWEPTGYADHETVGIYLSVSRQVGDRTVYGSATTFVNARNLPK